VKNLFVCVTEFYFERFRRVSFKSAPFFISDLRHHIASLHATASIEL